MTHRLLVTAATATLVAATGCASVRGFGTSSPTSSGVASGKPVATAPVTVAGPPRAATSGATPTPVDPTANWTVVNDPQGGFSLRIPPTWKAAGPCVDTGQFAGDAPVYEVVIGLPQFASACPTGAGSTGVSVSSTRQGATPAPYSGCTMQAQTVVADGVTGTRQAGHCTGQSFIEYEFVRGGMVFSVDWDNWDSEPDITPTLDLAVSTLRFTS